MKTKAPSKHAMTAARLRFGRKVKLAHAMKRAAIQCEAEANMRARNAYREAIGLPPVK